MRTVRIACGKAQRRSLDHVLRRTVPSRLNAVRALTKEDLNREQIIFNALEEMRKHKGTPSAEVYLARHGHRGSALRSVSMISIFEFSV